MNHSKTLTILTNFSFSFFPFSLIIGSLIVNINLALFIISSFFLIKKESIQIKFNSINITLLLFFITIIFSSFVNLKIIGYENFLKSFFLFKFYLVYLLLETLIENNKINLDFFFKISFFLTIFISLDVILQFHFGKNILGYPPFQGRITGIFGPEAIAGAFIQKFFLFSIIGILLIFKNKKFNNIFFFFIFISAYGAFVASNRMSAIIVLFSIFFIFITLKNFRKPFSIFFIIFLPIVFFSYKYNENIKYKIDNFYHSIEKSFTFFKTKEKEHIKINSHLGIYYATIESFKQNVIIGNGLKSFRHTCFELNIKNKTCSIHPHNFHLEILHDVGIIGFILISLFVFQILLKIYRLYFLRKFDDEEKIIFFLIILNFLIEIFPIKSTGSFFTTWNGSILWFSICIINYLKKLNHHE